MATGSTASSGTDGPEPRDPEEIVELASDASDEGEPAAPGTAPGGQRPDGAAVAAGDADAEADGVAAAAGPADTHDPDRRAFFFQFGKQAVTAVGQVAGMADIVSRTSSTAAASLLGLDQPAGPAERPEFTRSGSEPVVSAVAPPAAEDSFRSPYRLDGDELVMLDQRGIPERLDEVVARRGSDVAYYLRVGVSRGGPRMAQEAAYGLALTAAERVTHPGAARETELRRTRRTLIEARPSSRLLRWAMARTETATAAHDEATDGTHVASELRAAADELARQVQVGHAAIAAAIAASLPSPTDRPLGVLVHGDQGSIAGGLVGTGLAALRRLRDDGRELRVFVTEGRPFMDGARVASWELRQAGVSHKVVADAAVPWLLGREAIDVILVGAEWVAANGDVGAVIGSRAVAVAATRARGRDAGPVVVASGLSAVIDPGTATGADIPQELRPARDLSTYLADVPIKASDALVPASDVIDAADVASLVTERGVATPVTAETVASLADPEAAG